MWAWLGAVSLLAMAQVASATSNLPPPTVTITSPASSVTFTAPATITLQATASSPNGAIKWVQYFTGTTFVGMATQPPYTVTWKNVAAGSYAVTALTNDVTETSARSAAVAISVTGGSGGGGSPPPPPATYIIAVINGTVGNGNASR